MSKPPGFPSKPPSTNPFTPSGASTPPAQSPFPRPNPPQNPLGGLGARFGAKAMWEILSMTDMLVAFDLAAVAEALVTEFDLPTDAPPVETFLTLLVKNKPFAEALRERLDEAWQGFDLHGAFLVFNWRDEIKQAVNARLVSVKEAAVYTLARDPLLVLNVLGRARTSLLLATAPLALDRPFLMRSLVCDDARLVKLARAGAFTTEFLVEQPTEELEEEE
jgi:hypothetical protein